MIARNQPLFTGLLACALLSGGAHAANIPYAFDITIDTGTLTPNTYQGWFAYDNVTMKVVDFEFQFEGTTYTEANDPQATAVFNNSVFTGLAYSVSGTPSLAFVPGTTALNEAYFAYDLNSSPPGPAGTGEILYTAYPNVADTPGPSAALGAAAALGWSRRMRRRIASGRKS